MMVLINKVLKNIKKLKGCEPVDLDIVLKKGELTPPGSLEKRISMAPGHCSSNLASGVAGTSAASASTFPSEKFMDLFVHHVVEQKVQLEAVTWRSIAEFYNNCDFSNRCKAQIPLEALLTISKADPSDILRCMGSNDFSKRSKVFDGLVYDFIANIQPQCIRIADDLFSEKVKKFLTQPAIVEAFRFCFDNAFNSGEAADGEKSSKKRRIIDKDWITEQIKHMNIYDYTDNGDLPLKGVVLTDGILICSRKLVDSKKSENRHDASLFTLACHESAHFLARAFVGDYNFSSPFKDLDGEKTTMRLDRVIVGKALEMGRYVELVLFDDIQPDWLESYEQAAIEFIKGASKQALCPPALIKRELHKELGLESRTIPSCSFGAELVGRKFFLE